MGLMGRTPDYMNVTYAGFAGRADEWAINGNEEGADNLVAYQKTTSAPRYQPDAYHRSADRRQEPRRRAADRRHGRAAQGRKHRAWHPGARLARAGDAGAVRRRDRGLSGGAAQRRHRRARGVVQHPHGHARPQISVPGQFLARRQQIRFSAVEPLRRTGRLRHLRQCRGAARPRLHRRQHGGLQFGDGDAAGGPTSCSRP